MKNRLPVRAHRVGVCLRNVLSVIAALVFAWLVFAWLAASGALAADSAAKPKPQQDAAAAIIDFAAPAAALQLDSTLSRYHAPGGEENDGTVWYITTI